MQLSTKRTQLRIDWLMLLFPLLAAALGHGKETALLFLSLAVHETAHFLAARMLNLSFHTLRLTPFGGMAQIDNPYSITPLRLCIVSAAGPAANFLLILFCASFCHWQLLGFETASQLIHINAMLMLFNLLPALPLDGGRILYALLSLIMPRRRAVEGGILLGRILAAVLIALAIFGCIRRNTLNLSPVFAAVFLIVSASDERSALTDSRLHTFAERLKPIRTPTEAQIVAISTTTPAETVLRSVTSDKITFFAIFDHDVFIQFLDDRTYIHRLLQSSDKKSQQNQK